MANTVILTGNLGQDPKIKTFDDGNRVCTFSLATTENWKNKQGEKMSHTDWHNIKVNGKMAEIAHKYLKKGSKVHIQGKIRYREYEKDGVKKYFTEILAREVEFLSSNNQSSEQPMQQQDDHDYLPF